MNTFSITFHRYSKGEGRFSAPQRVAADDLHAASILAGLMLRAMAGADPVARYAVAKIEAEGFRGEVCNGIHMFETSEEAETRLASGR